MNKEELLAAVKSLAPGIVDEEKANCPAVQVPADMLLAVAAKVKDQKDLSFDMLLSHTAVHWVDASQFELLYRLYSTRHKHHLLLTCRITDGAAVASVSSVWHIAEWQEREVYDLYGVRYAGHPDLRRLFLEDDWQGYPLRKDYKDDFILEGP